MRLDVHDLTGVTVRRGRQKILPFLTLPQADTVTGHPLQTGGAGGGSLLLELNRWLAP